MQSQDLGGILFDLDGVLIDSMRYHAESFERVLEDVGIEVDREEIYEREGEGAELIISDILERNELDFSEEKTEQIVKRKREIFDQIERTRAFEGMEELLSKLAEKYKLGLVSGSSKREVMKFVDEFYPDLFDFIVTEDDLEKQKPSPEPYLTCLESLDLVKGETVVVENAPLGIRSAKSAGLKCVAVATYLPKERLQEAGADKVFENHEELGGWMRRKLL